MGVYACSENPPLGRSKELRLTLDPYEPALLAFSATPFPVLEMSAPERVGRGQVASLAFRMSSPTPAAIHSVHLDLSDPDGKSALQYSGNLLLRDGAAERLLPFPLNDKPGKWTVQAHDRIGGGASPRPSPSSEAGSRPRLPPFVVTFLRTRISARWRHLMKFEIRNRIVCLAIAILVAAPPLVRGQRLPGRIDGRAKTLLRGSRNSRADRLESLGPVDDGMRVQGMTFRFRPTPAQSAELDQLLEDQQNPSSARYHAWLTPEEYGERFGLSQGDFRKMTNWLEAQGFQIDSAARSRTHITFSGTANQVRRTFDTELDRYQIHGREYFANAREAAVPVEIEPLVYTLQGLDDLPEEPHIRTRPRINGNDGSHALTPGDLAVIYNLVPLWKMGIAGSGQKIVVTGQSAFNLQDVRDFRDAAGLPPSEPKVMLMPGSKDPGFNGASGEALLDIQYAGGGAPGASIIYVYGVNANLAAQYAVDQNLAPVITESFGLCEKRDTSWLWFRNVAQQAAAQGITWVVSSGDSGAAACDTQLSNSVGVSGIATAIPASIPEVTAIGGTTFVEGNGKYWSATQADDGTSALSYIPERGWNDSGPGKLLGASGGGMSIAFPRPTWQTGPGVPNDNARHVPDLAFPASQEHDPYLMIENGSVVETGGTSAGTPFFAGVVATLNQYVVATGIQARPGLGNLNPRLYQLAQTTQGVFHDITTGDNIVPCKPGTPDCTTGQYGYRAGPGYDHVTGLGSVDIANLFENWAVTKSTPKTTSTVVMKIEPSPVYQQAPDKDGFAWFYTLKITETGGAATTLTGFSIDGYDLSDGIADWFGTTKLAANGSLSLDMRGKDLNVPSDHVFALAGVDASGQRWGELVNVSFLGPKPNTSGAMTLTSDPATVSKGGDASCAADHPYGQTLILRETGGSAVKLTKFVAGGYDYSDRIASWFGSQTLSANGTLQAKICWQINSPPVTLAYEMDGVDGSGHPVQATLNVQFRGSILDEKSGGPTPEPAPLSAWPGARARRPAAPHRQIPGMTVGPRRPEGAASAPLRK